MMTGHDGQFSRVQWGIQLPHQEARVQALVAEVVFMLVISATYLLLGNVLLGACNLVNWYIDCTGYSLG